MLALGQLLLQQALQALVHMADTLQQRVAVRSQQFGSSSRGRGAYVGDKIADAGICFMPYGADHWRAAGGNGTGQGFFIEAPEIFQRAAAAGQDYGVEAAAIGQLQGVNDLRAGLIALNLGGYQRQGNMGRPAGKHATDILPDSAGGRGNYRNAGGKSRQLLFVLRGKQPFSQQALLEGFKGCAQGAFAGSFDLLHYQLVVAPGFIQRNPAAGHNLAAIGQLLTAAQGIAAKKSTAYLCFVVLQGKIDVT